MEVRKNRFIITHGPYGKVPPLVLTLRAYWDISIEESSGSGCDVSVCNLAVPISFVSKIWWFAFITGRDNGVLNWRFCYVEVCVACRLGLGLDGTMNKDQIMQARTDVR